MIDRLMAFVAISILTAFCTLVVIYVGRLDLGIVIAACLALGAFDLLYYSFKSRDGKGKG